MRADVIAALLLGAGADPAPGDRPALRLTGARITGGLDLRLRGLALPRSFLPGLAADTAAGWILATTVSAGISRAISRQ
ncbi:hypothetical protein [Streptomyces canus]|uniref:hypothetical protein n=1 Tax=Streptomyces canus TaxID=58343 RepID=UPI0036ECA0B2